MHARRRIGATVSLAMLAAFPAGCGSMRVTGTPRSGTEQLLLSSAFDAAIAGVDFRPLLGVPVFLDTTNLQAIDDGWITFRVRQSMIRQGLVLVADEGEARAIVEVAVGTYGTDTYDWMIGVPQFSVPAGLPGVPVPGGTVPELALAKKTRQYGLVKLAFFARDRETGRYVWESGTLLSDSDLKNAYYGGLGPVQSGSISGQLGRRGLRGQVPTLPIGRGITIPGPEPRAPHRHHHHARLDRDEAARLASASDEDRAAGEASGARSR